MAFHIDEKTKISLYAVFIAIPTVIGGILWLSAIYASVAQATSVNAAQDVKIEQSRDLLIDIRERIIRIETKLDK